MISLNLTTDKKNFKKLKAYLEENVSEVLADKINNGVYIEKDGKRLLNRKDLTGFMEYANKQARELAEKGTNYAIIDDDEVFGWSIHYFEEDSIFGTLYNEDGTVYEPPKPVVKRSNNAATIAASTTPPAPKPLSLFDLMESAETNATGAINDDTVDETIKSVNEIIIEVAETIKETTETETVETVEEPVVDVVPETVVETKPISASDGSNSIPSELVTIFGNMLKMEVQHES